MPTRSRTLHHVQRPHPAHASPRWPRPLPCPALVALVALACVAIACDEKPADPASDSATLDTAADGATADTGAPLDADHGDLSSLADDDADTTRPTLPVYSRTYPPAETFPAPAGKVWRRAIVHLHSTHSHDACDGAPRLEDGAYNGPCLADLRAALCTVGIDFAYLTDHHGLMASTPFLDAMLHDPATDTLVERNGAPIANRIPCADGRSVTTTVGMETDLMPLAFPSPLDPDPATNEALLSGSDEATAQRFREAGALLWVAHTEQYTVTQLQAWQVDGLELYNLHANIDPRVLGLPLDPLVQGLLPFILGNTKTHPDLSLLFFLTENTPALDAWATILSQRPVVATAGTDAHQNVLPPPLSDGERFDSYRRMLGWFSNYVLADDDGLDAFHTALSQGRLFVGFDTLASPAGFDVALFDASANRYELGATVDFAAGMALTAVVPAVPDDEAPPTLETLLLRADNGHWTEVTRAAGPGTHTWPLEAPGVYRVEVRMTPHHLARYVDHHLPDELATRPMTWIYSNAFRVMPQ